MKRYLLFAWPNYEASGGWRDFCGSYNTIKEAQDYYKSRDDLVKYCDSGQIVDTEATTRVEGRQDHGDAVSELADGTWR